MRATSWMTWCVVLVGIVAACSGAASPTPSPSSSSTTDPTNDPTATPSFRHIGSIALGPSGCQVTGSLAGPRGAVTFDVSNDTEFVGIVELLRLADDHPWDELVEWVAEEGRRAAADEGPMGRPPWSAEVARVELDPAATARLSAVTQTGTHALVCILVAFPPTDNNPVQTMVTVGPYEVD